MEWQRWYGIVAVVAIFLGGLIAFRSFLYEPFHIPSEAMYPTLPEGSLVFVKKLGYGDYGSMGVRLIKVPPTASVTRGELLLFRLAQDPKIVYVKRVIGLPGDRVHCAEERITVNGKPLEVAPDGTDDLYHYAKESIDNVTFTVAHLRSRPAQICDLVVPKDHYYMLGDNRENSKGSRHLGPVSREHLVGRVAAIIPLP